MSNLQRSLEALLCVVALVLVAIFCGWTLARFGGAGDYSLLSAGSAVQHV